MKEVILKKPVMFDGVEYQKLNLDFDELSGHDLINATKEAEALGDQSRIIEFSKVYQAVVVAKAAKVPVDLILSLKARDFTEVTLRTQNFLIGWELTEASTKPSGALQ